MGTYDRSFGFDAEMTTPTSALTFPCDFTIKVMGKNNPLFEEAVAFILKTHYPTITDNAFSKRPSKDNNYIAISITVQAISKEQLDALYQQLSDEPSILMAL